MTAALIESRDRYELIRQHMDAASASLCRDDLAGVQRLCERAIETLSGVDVAFRHDWLALDTALSTIATARAWAQRKASLAEAATSIEPLLRRAVALRLRWLAGDEP